MLKKKRYKKEEKEKMNKKEISIIKKKARRKYGATQKNMDILAEINEIANEYVGDVNLKLDDTFDSLDFDSLDVVQIAMAVEKKYGIKFPDKIEAKTVGDLVKMVEELTK